MNWINSMQNAIDYIEENLTEELDYAEIARKAYSSNFHFQRVFSILCGYTMGEYIRNRRLTLAGSDLASSDIKVIDAALKYGYETPESFSRAFTRFHGITPTQARAHSAGLKLFSRLSLKLVLEGGATMDYRIEKRDAFKVIARKERFSREGEITQQHIHSLWEKSIKDGTIDKLCSYINPKDIFGGAVAGISFDNPDEGDFDYAIGVVYEDGQVADGLTVEVIPANTWMVFSGTGIMPDAFKDLWKRIYTEVFPTSSYQPSGGMCIEVYPSDEVFSDNFTFEIWLSVSAK